MLAFLLTSRYSREIDMKTRAGTVQLSFDQTCGKVLFNNNLEHILCCRSLSRFILSDNKRIKLYPACFKGLYTRFIITSSVCFCEIFGAVCSFRQLAFLLANPREFQRICFIEKFKVSTVYANSILSWLLNLGQEGITTLFLAKSTNPCARTGNRTRGLRVTTRLSAH